MKNQKIFSLSPSHKKESEILEGNLLRFKLLGFELVLCNESVDKLIVHFFSYSRWFTLLLLFRFLVLNGFHVEANKVLQALLSFL
jgi:hypothetical protein